jgi:DNA (cytosine-5)-methyltransferase 1
MIQPREQLYAQRFPSDYVVIGGRAEQTMQAGNAVSCNVAQWVGHRVWDALNRTAALAA